MPKLQLWYPILFSDFILEDFPGFLPRKFDISRWVLDPLVTTCFTGGHTSSGRRTARIKMVFSLWKSIFRWIILSSPHMLRSRPMFTTRTSALKEQYVWTFWRRPGVQLSRFQKFVWWYVLSDLRSLPDWSFLRYLPLLLVPLDFHSCLSGVAINCFVVDRPESGQPSFIWGCTAVQEWPSKVQQNRCGVDQEICQVDIVFLFDLFLLILWSHQLTSIKNRMILKYCFHSTDDFSLFGNCFSLRSIRGRVDSKQILSNHKVSRICHVIGSGVMVVVSTLAVCAKAVRVFHTQFQTLVWWVGLGWYRLPKCMLTSRDISSHRIVADEDTQAGERAGVVEKLQPLLHGRVGRQGFGGKVRLLVS